MDRIELTQPLQGSPNASKVPSRVDAPAGSQSKLPWTLLLVLVAAALFRIVTAVTDRTKSGAEGAGLVRWMGGQSAGEAARVSGKPILYDFTAEWCGPCRMLDADAWGDSKIAALVNDSYVPARVVDRVREEGKNPAWIDELQRRYEVGAFPTLVIAAPDGRMIAATQGYAGKQKLVEFLEGSRRSAGGPVPPITR